MSETMTTPRAILITGTSTGIGAACAIELDRRGFKIFAGVRTYEAGQKLQEKASSLLTPVLLDVTDAATIAAAAAIIKEQTGHRGLAGLINNAGITISGPLELIPINELRRQFEVNVIGQIAVTQAVLPLLRTAKGRIVNIGSVNGALSPPYLGPYAASKFALEALTDALRMELRTWDIHVSLIEPGPVATPIWDKSFSTANRLEKEVPNENKMLYEPDLSAVRKMMAEIASHAEAVDIVVRAAVHALTAPNPKTRYFLHYRNRFLFRGFKLVPDVIRDWLIRIAMKLP
jgi:NAD(P)-dependent dehydrogenase (short-subunit alcohol dehydrogenase family)